MRSACRKPIIAKPVTREKTEQGKGIVKRIVGIPTVSIIPFFLTHSKNGLQTFGVSLRKEGYILKNSRAIRLVSNRKAKKTRNGESDRKSDYRTVFPFRVAVYIQPCE